MVLRMARPWKHPTTGIYYLRERIPRDVLAKARGTKITLPSEAGASKVTLGAKSEHVKASLRSREPREAKERHAAALSHLAAVWASIRNGPSRLTHKQAVALSKWFYDVLATGFEDDPGSVDRWRDVRKLNEEAKEGCLSLKIGDDNERREWSMQERYGRIADHILVSKALNVDTHSRNLLLNELARASTQAAHKLERNAEGDYTPDANANRFPKWEEGRKASLPSSGSITELVAGWERESRAAGLADKTFKEYRSVVKRFVALPR